MAFVALCLLGPFALARGAGAQAAPPPSKSQPPVAAPATGAAAQIEQELDPDPVLAGTPVEKRERIRICGSEWIGMNKSGAAAGSNWRDFSRDCYARALPRSDLSSVRPAASGPDPDGDAAKSDTATPAPPDAGKTASQPSR